MTTNDSFEIKIDFERGVGDPARVFRTMSGLIEAVQSLDNHLANSINVSITSRLILEDIESGSLKAKLKNVIEAIPDEAIKKGDVKMLVGHYLYQAKHKIIDWCSDKDEIRDRGELKQLEGELLQLAENTDINHLPAYAPIKTEMLLSDITLIQDSLQYMSEKDIVMYQSPSGKSTFNPKLAVSAGVVRDVLTREVIQSTGIRILKVKKPDYLGNSRWSFKYMGHSIEATIADSKWLARFHNRLEILQPGDAIKANVREIVSYGYDGEIVHTDHEILEVIEILPAPKMVQGDLLEGS